MFIESIFMIITITVNHLPHFQKANSGESSVIVQDIKKSR